MKFREAYIKGQKIRLLKGGSIGSVLLDGGRGGQSAYSSVDEYKRETRGAGLTHEALRRLEQLKPKPLLDGKRANIRFSI